MTTSIVSFNGHTINDGTVYASFFRVDDRVRRRTVGTSLVTPAGRHPELTSTTRTEALLPLRIQILSGTLQDKQDELDKWLRPGTTGYLVADFGTSRRRISCTVQQIIPYDGAPNIYTAILLAPDARWLSGWTECYDAGGLKTSGDLITDTTRATATEGDGLADVDRVGIWRASTNLFANGGFESNTTGWATGGTNTLATSAAQRLFGSQSALVTVGDNASLIRQTIGVSSSTNYVVTGWVYIPASWTQALDIRWTVSFDVGTPVVDFRIDGDVTVRDSWQRFQIRFMTDALTTTATLSAGPTVAPTAADTIYFDGMQLEQDTHSTPYIETDGSTASRNAPQVQIDAVSLSETKGWFAARMMSGFTEDPSGITNHGLAYAIGWGSRVTGDSISVLYNDVAGGGGSWDFRRMASSSGTNIPVAATQSVGDLVTVICKWTATEISLSVNGTAFASTANVTIPSLGDLLDIGNETGISQLDGDMTWFAAGTGTLTDADSATISAFGDTHPTTWPDAADHCLSWVADDLAVDTQRLTINNAGNIPATDAVITVQPLEAKAAADDWLYSRQVVVANRIGNAFVDWAVELTDGGWDHAAEVLAGRSQADGDDVRIIIDGEEVPRWDGAVTTTAWDQTGTLVWVNVTLSPGNEAEVLTAMASGASPAVGGTMEFQSGSLADWPASGTMLIGTEAIDYSGATVGDSKDTAVVVARGARNTTAAAHSISDVAFWVERDIQIIFGHTTIGAPDNQDHRKPMISLNTSSNDEHQWLDFAHDADPRSMQWARVQRTRDSQSDLIISGGGEPVTDATLEYALGGPVAGKPSFNGWAFRVPSGTRYGIGNHAMNAISMVVADTIFANWFGIDGDGNETNILNSGLGNIGTSGTHLSDEPAAPLFALEFAARNAVVVNSPSGTEDISATSGTIAVDAQLTQAFTVPESVGRFAFIDAIAVRLKVDTGGVILDVVVAQDDGTGTFVYLTPGTSYTVTSTSFVWAIVKLSSRIRVTPGDTLSVLVKWDSISSGVPTVVTWETVQQSYQSLAIVHSFRILSNTLDPDTNAEGVDGDSALAQSIAVFYNDVDNTRPFVSMQARENLYWLDGVLTNTTNGDAITFAVPAAIDDEIVVDVDARTVRNVTRNLNAFNGATFGDASDWLALEVGDNLLTYVEDSVVSTRVQVGWSHHWES